MSYDTSSEQISFSEKQTLSRAVNEYLKTRKNCVETWLLNQFKEDMQNKRPNVHIQDITIKDFECFLDSLKVSDATRMNYESRMKRFQQSIGLSEVKVKKNRNPQKDDKSVILDLEKKLFKTEKERDEEKQKVAAHSQTIDEIKAEKEGTLKKYTLEKDKECSQCPKIAPLNAKIDKLQSVQYIIDSGEFEKVQQLLGQETQMKEQIAKGTEIIKNQRIIKVPCPTKRRLVPFGNDCMECKTDYISCPTYQKLMNPEDPYAPEKA